MTTAPTATLTLTIRAYFTTAYDRGPEGMPGSFQISGEVDTPDEARAIAARFPKSAGVRGVSLSTHEPGDFSRHITKGLVSAHGALRADGVNAGVNETGIRRYRAILRTAAKLGIRVDYCAVGGNAYPTREAFEAAIGVAS